MLKFTTEGSRTIGFNRDKPQFFGGVSPVAVAHRGLVHQFRAGTVDAPEVEYCKVHHSPALPDTVPVQDCCIPVVCYRRSWTLLQNPIESESPNIIHRLWYEAEKRAYAVIVAVHTAHSYDNRGSPFFWFSNLSRIVTKRIIHTIETLYRWILVAKRIEHNVERTNGVRLEI
jgi:hypothetical protein